MFSIPIQYYIPVYYWLMFFFCFLTGWYYFTSNNCSKLLVQNSGKSAWLFLIPLVLYVGLRPISARYFGDMKMYAYLYGWTKTSTVTEFFSVSSEWVFDFIMKTCKLFFNDVSAFFLLVEALYMGLQLWACKRFLKENLWVAMMFVFFAYQFFTYGVNGMRNGLACAMIMLAFSFIAERNKKSYLTGGFICLLALGCHRSVMIPIASIILALTYIKKTKTAILIWMGCIFLSVVAGGFFQNIFISLGFDDRMSSYAALDTARFSHSGFRWDFLLYSAMPVWLAKYVDDRGIRDATFSLLANTYIIANSFWVLVCRVAFSNRFAYLSWFMYGLVLAYAVVRVPIWRDQDKKAGLILMAHTAFTMGMFLIGK